MGTPSTTRFSRPTIATLSTSGVFSPDGSALAYQSDEAGEYNIYVGPLSG